MRLMRILNLEEDEYDNLSSNYSIHSPHANNMSFEDYLDRELVAGRLTRHRGDLSGCGGDPSSQKSGPPYQEATGHSNDGRTLVSPRPGEPRHDCQDAGLSNPDRTLSGPGPHESGHRSQEAGRSNNDRTIVSHPRPRPREDYMHHATGPSRGAGGRRGTSCRECEDSLDDDASDGSSSSDDAPASSPGTDTNRFPEDRPVRGRGTDFFCETGFRYPVGPNNDRADHDCDAHPRGGRSEAIRPPIRRGPVSIPQRRIHSPPSRSVQSPPPIRPDYFAPRGYRVPPSPFTLGSLVQSPPSTRPSQAYSTEGRSGAGYVAPQSGSQCAPITANGAYFGETYYDPRSGSPPDYRRGGSMRDD